MLAATSLIFAAFSFLVAVLCSAVGHASASGYLTAMEMAPNANAFAESWIGSLKHECLNHLLCFGPGHHDHIMDGQARFITSIVRIKASETSRSRTLRPDDRMSMG